MSMCLKYSQFETQIPATVFLSFGELTKHQDLKQPTKWMEKVDQYVKCFIPCDHNAGCICKRK